jgi:U3 small nucleolar RNA-associated protein 15
VLKPYVVRKKPEYTFSLLMELSRRGGLRLALAACDARFTKLLVHIADLLLELFLPEHGTSGRVDRLFKQLWQKLDKEVAYCEQLMQLQGAVDLVLIAIIIIVWRWMTGGSPRFLCR